MLRRFTFAQSVGLSLPVVASADKPDKRKHKKQKVDRDVNVTGVIGSQERESVQKCPPGLAKKNNGCLPPGQANKRCVVGRHYHAKS